MAMVEAPLQSIGSTRAITKRKKDHFQCFFISFDLNLSESEMRYLAPYKMNYLNLIKNSLETSLISDKPINLLSESELKYGECGAYKMHQKYWSMTMTKGSEEAITKGCVNYFAKCVPNLHNKH